MTTRPLVVSFVGPSGVGKTTLVERLVPALAERGLRVATVKHAPHGFDADRAGSDSWRHQRAGADSVLLAGPDSAVLFIARPGATAAPTESPGGPGHHRPTRPTDLSWLSELIDTRLAGHDVVLAEGYTPLSDLVVVVRRAGVAPKVAHEPIAPWLTMADVVAGRDQLALDDVAELAARIAAHVAGR